MTLHKAYGHAMAFTANVIFGLAVPVTQLLLLHRMTLVGYTFSRVVFASAVFWTAGPVWPENMQPIVASIASIRIGKDMFS